MAEQLKSITDARKSLREISETAQSHRNRYIITNQGQPQSVLLGYKEYQAMKATVELLNRPEAMTRLQTGLEQLNRGERLTFDEVKQNLRRRATADNARLVKLYHEQVLGEASSNPSALAPSTPKAGIAPGRKAHLAASHRKANA